ncbi:mitochondrial ribosomal death-associated protein 3-domain-containing protein [Boeremia exigua]|uniref:mitochondrial ribosomal death-associated protein 3-domain-containing protein n=1 Tax=Boeremia exigua TaxID=749465 RepID=UPI001E8E4722|nr:mitochondrial ribosomal death-associated protein 3-domain-containing protein [Boeremia exigua]KAH6612481.1 mitochondrial ribosomal death-associated protein 3-domain-containing protein [Boeremia exigua]
MPSANCLRSLSQLSLDATAHATAASRFLHPRVACFSTSTARHANNTLMKKKGMVAAPKKGVKTLNTKKSKGGGSADAGKRPAPGARKAQRKRIVLSNDNALEVSSLKDLTKATVFSEANEGRVVGLPEPVVDALRSVDAFKVTQGWSFFRRPAVLMRKEAIHLAKLFQDVEEAATGKDKKTIRRIITGQRMGGKTTLLLQGLSVAFLRQWFVINLPECYDIVNAHTEYAPLEGSEPTQYTQDMYTATLLSQTLKANEAYFEQAKITQKHDLNVPLPASGKLKDLIAVGMANPDVAWPVFKALWAELSQPGQPQILLAADGLSHMMRNSDYLNADVKPIHAHDLTIVRHFVDHLSGVKQLPNGGIVLAATSKSNARSSPAMDFRIKEAEAIKAQTSVPQWNPYTSVDKRTMDALKDLADPKADLDILEVGGVSKEEARSIMEYYAESGMLKHQVNDVLVTEKWSLAGMGNIGELEKASVRTRL